MHKHPEASAYLYNKKKLIIFNDINVSLIVEKKIGDTNVPIPLVIEKINEKSALEITEEIEKAKKQELTPDDDNFAFAWGASGRLFESDHPDSVSEDLKTLST